jgi:hypothetical protein
MLLCRRLKAFDGKSNTIELRFVDQDSGGQPLTQLVLNNATEVAAYGSPEEEIPLLRGKNYLPPRKKLDP